LSPRSGNIPILIEPSTAGLSTSMEDPINFDLWGKPLATERERALDALRSHGVFESELDLRKVVHNAIRSNSLMKIAGAMGYAEVRALAQRFQSTFTQCAVYQAGWAPDGGGSYCDKHGLHYGGCLGCHVCSGFYVR